MNHVITCSSVNINYYPAMLIIIPVGLIARLIVLCVKACRDADCCNKKEGEERVRILPNNRVPQQYPGVTVTSQPKSSAPKPPPGTNSTHSSTSYVPLPPANNVPPPPKHL